MSASLLHSSALLPGAVGRSPALPASQHLIQHSHALCSGELIDQRICPLIRLCYGEVGTVVSAVCSQERVIKSLHKAWGWQISGGGRKFGRSHSGGKVPSSSASAEARAAGLLGTRDTGSEGGCEHLWGDARATGTFLAHPRSMIFAPEPLELMQVLP